jgi:hypothetical protein
MDDFAPEPVRRGTDEPVVITTRDIYTLAAETAGKVDTVLSMVTSAQRTDDDHETRIRRLEARFMGIVATFGFALTAGAAWIGAAIMDTLGGS